jgi:hypothetical protein
MADRKIIGYQPIYAPLPGQVVTHAFLMCSRCGCSIASSNGPGYEALCLKCVGGGMQGRFTAERERRGKQVALRICLEVVGRPVITGYVALPSAAERFPLRLPGQDSPEGFLSACIAQAARHWRDPQP